MAVTTNVPQPTFSATGFVSPAQADILAGVWADWQAACGGNLNEDLRTPQGQLVSSEAAAIANVYNALTYYSSQVDPAYAQGRYQDAIGRIYYIERFPSLPTVLQVTCIGGAGVIIPQSAQVSDPSNNLYQATESATIPIGGSVVIPFAALVAGPIAVPASVAIYQSTFGWDAVSVASGTVGQNTETRSAFELRRAQSTALNAIGSLPAILGEVLAVSGVLDAYVTDNSSGSPLTVGGVTLNPNSIYVAAVGGLASAIAAAIWTHKMPGCAYTGNTSVTVYDTSPQYASPGIPYQVTFEIPINIEFVISVVILNSPLVPANAAALIQGAIISAFAGGDGGPRVKIGSKVLSSRFYPPIAALGPWAQIVSISMGTTNSPACNFTASIAGTTMTVTAVSANTLAAGQTIFDATGLLAQSTVIGSQSSGTTGGIGVYVVNNSQSVPSEAMQAVAATLNEVVVQINQEPSVLAANITVSTV